MNAVTHHPFVIGHRYLLYFCGDGCDVSDACYGLTILFKCVLRSRLFAAAMSHPLLLGFRLFFGFFARGHEPYTVPKAI